MTIYEFSWRPLKYDPIAEKDGSYNAITYVQTHDENLMRMFLTQHGFDPNTPNVKIIEDPQYNDDDTIALHTYQISSRERGKVYKITTTFEIMERVINEIAYELNQAMTFGSCALKCEIQLFERIQELMDELDYVCIQETSSTNASGFDEMAEYGYYRISGRIPDNDYEELSRDDQQDTVFADLIETVNDHKLLPIPITIESYVSFFTDIYLIGKEVKQHG